MITFETFLAGLMIVSTLTSLVTEAVKKILDEHNKKYHSNTLVGIISALLSAAIGVCYMLMASVGFNVQSIVCLLAMIFLSWLCAMVGYDKVVGSIKNTKEGKIDEDRD
jgi:ABC-type uncharacterized transport system permease subunit